jgi:hypothetical protein
VKKKKFKKNLSVAPEDKVKKKKFKKNQLKALYALQPKT